MKTIEQKAKKVPTIRFAGFEDEWVEKKLGDVANSFGYGLNAAAMPYDGINKYLRITDIDDLSREFKKDDLTTPDFDLVKASDYRLDEGDLLFARTGASVGKTFIYKKNDGLVYFAGFLIRTKIKSEYDSKFIFQNTLTNSYDKFVKITSQRSGQPGINAQEYADYSLLMPKLNEQQKIGSFFSNIDSLISLEQKKYDKLTQVKKSMLEKMFPKEGMTVPEIRFATFTGEWEKKKLGDMGTTYTGLSGKTKSDFGHGMGRFVTYMNVFLNPVSDPNRTEAVEIDNTQNTVQHGDVFFTTSSETPEEVGMSSVWLDKTENIYLNSFCFGYRPTENIDPFYLAYMLRSNVVRKKITYLAQGISRYNISKNGVMEIEVPLPNFKEQQKIGSYFSHLDSLISLQQRKLEKLKNIKKSLLEKMFV
ncbi:restriction endonuclease subunit S [Fibrobacter sp.]|uniref:restriction endonuclease subunit S n=1 Tax=Fibrobacter sp. TaxID=35828 RepID=UPI00262DE85C|nr:restriction endonuclease subunit S [Fibrobacter sp.]MDD5942110.1 restriction endonuclease subunit S [Fibrobacter sp.]